MPNPKKYHLENLWKFCIGSCCLEQDHLEKYHLYELFLNVLKWKKLTASRTLQFCSRLTKWHYRHLTQKLQRTGNVEFPCWIEQWHPKVQKCPPTELIIPNYPFHCWFYPPTFSLRVWFFFIMFNHIKPPFSHMFPFCSPSDLAARWAPAPPREFSSWPPACLGGSTSRGVSKTFKINIHICDHWYW